MKMRKSSRLSLVCTAVLGALASAPALAIEDAKQAFVDDASSKLHTFLYIRDREQRNDDGKFVPNIENQTLQMAWDYRSGYYKDTIGLDIWANTNLQVGGTTGMSEILYYDHACEEKDDGSYTSCEKSYSAISVAALKAKLGDKEAGLNLRAGYTRINMGTIRSSWGLNPHAYRGLEAKANFGDLTVGYAIADQFKNDWRKEFQPMTTKWHQNQHPDASKHGGEIDYIHTIGASYKLGDALIDGGYGIGKDYRTNWQLHGKYNFDLGEAKVNLSAFYHGSIAEESELTGVTDAKAESYIGLGAKIKHGDFTWTAGLSKIDTDGQAKTYNFRLTPWANSDNRSYQKAKSQVDDYTADGTQAVKLGVDYKFTSWGLPGLTAGISGNYGTNIISDMEKKEYDGTAHSFDWRVGYQFQEGGLKGLKVRVNRGKFRGEDVIHKKDRNDLKVLISYSVDLK